MTHPEHGTAVGKPKASTFERLLEAAKTSEERLQVYRLAEKRALQELVQEFVAEVRAKAWGDKVSPLLRAALVKWALENDIDPVEELDILGGAPYKNAKYYFRLLSNQPDFLSSSVAWLHDDERLTEEERASRRSLRAIWNVPDKFAATLGLHREAREAAAKKPDIAVRSAALVTLTFRDRGPFYGVKWAPSNANDPIGADFSEPTALTRAVRKAALLAVPNLTPIATRLKALREGQALGQFTPTAVPVIDTTPAPGEEIHPLREPQTISDPEPPRAA
jgi:hypothetical protein